LALDERALEGVRGNAVGMIFQEPMTSLNPVFSIGDQIEEAVLLHRDVGRKAARQRAIDLLARVGIPAPEAALARYPHELSGGQRQRVMIAIALACEPRLLIADEPTTALDVTVQAQILDLIDDLRRETGMAVLLITHDLGVVSELTTEVLVMYAGRIVERGATGKAIEKPLHPYTAGLLASLPTVGQTTARKRLQTIPGLVPDLIAPPRRCRFMERCPNAIERCGKEDPLLSELQPGQWAACFNPMWGNQVSAAITYREDEHEPA
jgi:oligopeptide/dipeptide ABC transporter ATP-binding protein